MAGQSGNDTDQAMTEKKTLDATVKAKIKEYTNTYDSRLLRAFKQDFDKWTLNNFNTVSVTELGKLVDLLQTNEPLNEVQQALNLAIFAPSTQSISQALVQLTKMYSDNQKYSGNEDSYRSKLRIFNDYCERLSLPKNVYKLAFPTMLKGQALDFYYDNKEIWEASDRDPVEGIRAYFEGPEYHRTVLDKWSGISLQNTVNEDPEKTLKVCLNMMLTELASLYDHLAPKLRNEEFYLARLLQATHIYLACQLATSKQQDTVPGLTRDLQSGVSQYKDIIKATNGHRTANPSTNIYFTDRRYYNQQSRSPSQGHSPRQHSNQRGRKKCFVCQKPDCWSTRHTPKERADSKRRYLDHFNKRIDQYIADYEGTEDDDEELPEELLSAADDLILTDDYKSRPTHDASSTLFTATFFTTHNNNDTNHGPSITMELANRSASHWIALLFLKPDLETNSYKTNEATLKVLNPESSHVYLNESRYSSESFKGIVIDTGAAQLSTAGYGQYLAYKRIVRNIDINTTTAGTATVQFGPGDPYQSIGSIDVPTPISTIRFHILTTTIPFLMLLYELDRLKLYFNNTCNLLVNKKMGKITPVIHQFGHPFLVWDYSYHTHLLTLFDYNPCLLTDTELRRLHH
ncbi:hypothetical protein TSTA_039980 [Talaromyces stipitatus ATCC 10500]|uniref:Uncharacterized protein n=1 Tax=Talaromyces stipitatus (strain ATCC 10500 / CBS 375.48 / QM 6759 / NRRL 1006) TaxID=441959 RepID=B8M461_TALSN|nr:uncharacterized protein TSTA_039980 [Talaromyces stipitatus ATCC 10500]EED20804.1 hypothetical protein TSTA_039980 [Talaromyces stipitatus ATCC 10500]